MIRTVFAAVAALMLSANVVGAAVAPAMNNTAVRSIA
ncbi:hypothetical protein GGR88_002336 [Sphingomonas jejuensis]|uniref:Uncharacterized protein n=1 Tax=Sphingomonas jejuensis TaxID=904715 RepID=A0ABX0XPP1_9SPHN|nr:hypothetical protein [Sphingomonas jejuensis]